MNTIHFHDERFDTHYTVFFSDTHILAVEREHGRFIARSVESLDYDTLPSSIKSELDYLLATHPSRRKKLTPE